MSEIREFVKILARDYKTFCECDVCHKRKEDILHSFLFDLRTILLGMLPPKEETNINESYQKGYNRCRDDIKAKIEEALK